MNKKLYIFMQEYLGYRKYVNLIFAKNIDEAKQKFVNYYKSEIPDENLSKFSVHDWMLRKEVQMILEIDDVVFNNQNDIFNIDYHKFEEKGGYLSFILKEKEK